MKIILASILALVASCVGASTSLETTGRDLQDDRYHVYQQLKLTWGIVPTNPNKEDFLLTAKHRAGDSVTAGNWKKQRYIYLFKTCPHGAGPDQAALANPNFLGRIDSDNTAAIGTQPSWLTTTTAVGTTGSGEQFETTVQFKILPSVVSAGTPVWTDQGANGGYAEMCIFFGVGDKDGKEVYGFREIILKATFVFDGWFKCTNFETQAYDPATGDKETIKKFGALALNCSPLDPVRPGTPVCIEVCADPHEKTVYVDTVNEMWMCESPDKTTAPDKTWILGGKSTLQGLPDATVGGTPKSVVVCDDTNGVLGDKPADGADIASGGTGGDANPNPLNPKRNVAYGCCRVMYTLPARYFPTVSKSVTADIQGPTKFDVAKFSVCGEVSIKPNPDPSGKPVLRTNPHGTGCKQTCQPPPDESNPPKLRRLEGGARQLQEEADDTGVVSGTIEVIVLPAEESSTKTVGVGAAAVVGALGAALLL